MQNTIFISNPAKLTENAVLASIRPKWNFKIFTNEKEAEIRKNKPSLDVPFRVLVYSTKPKPNTHGLCIADWAGKKKLGAVFPENYVTAEHMGMTLLDGKIIGEFICDRITEFKVFQNGSIQNWNFADLDKSCVPYEQIAEYVGLGRVGYAWHITEPVLYETPIPLSKAKEVFGLQSDVLRAPMSWNILRPERKCG